MCLQLICTTGLLQSCLPSWAVAQQHWVHTKHPKISNAWEAMKGAGPFRRNAGNVLNRWCHFSKGLKEEGERILAELSQSPSLSVAASWNKAKSVARTQCKWVYSRSQLVFIYGRCLWARSKKTGPMVYFAHGRVSENHCCCFCGGKVRMGERSFQHWKKKGYSVIFSSP